MNREEMAWQLFMDRIGHGDGSVSDIAEQCYEDATVFLEVGNRALPNPKPIAPPPHSPDSWEASTSRRRITTTTAAGTCS